MSEAVKLELDPLIHVFSHKLNLAWMERQKETVAQWREATKDGSFVLKTQNSCKDFCHCLA